jgi:sterol desaturase/sphingolipid hydroxylase (fatty acid hydroxylase superfamily)
MWIVMMYQSLSVLLSQFNHANITLPSKVNNILSWLIVTPDMHHVHHHYVQPYTDSNYGNISLFGIIYLVHFQKSTQKRLSMG